MFNGNDAAFLAFDGPNGSGKTSLVRAVAERLSEGGVAVMATREPTNSDLGRLIRSNEDKYRGRSLAYLVAADRLCHIEDEILPNLDMGKTVLSDRYLASSLALQYLDGVDMNTIWNLHQLCPAPVKTFIVSAPPEILAERLSRRATHSRFERTVSREAEIEAYRLAGDFLCEKGYTIEYIENTMPLPNVVEGLLAMILG